MSSLVSPSLVDYGSFTPAQRESLTCLGLGDRGAELRRHHGRTAASLERRGLIERRPVPHIPGWRLTAEGQATVIAHGWVGDLVLRADDLLDPALPVDDSPTTL